MLTAHLYPTLSRLIPKDEPFAIAFSGGGDSTALVHALKDYPQAKCVFIVDHNLRAGSDVEAQAAKEFAVECGYEVRLLRWAHKTPITGLQEKARKARYGLMGDECRKRNIKYLLTAHSEDDQAETLLMRYDRKTDWRGAAGMAEQSYGPVWPELAMVSIIRPLLSVTRHALRDYNREHKLTWAEDPSNENRNYARIRARDYLKGRSKLRTELLDTARDMQGFLDEEKVVLRKQFAGIGTIDSHGVMTLSETPVPELMLHSLRCAGGQGGTIDRAKIRKLLGQMRDPSFKSTTLGGALVAKDKAGFVICRDPVSVKGRDDSHHDRKEMRERLNLRLSDSPQIWDGRFSVMGSNNQSYMGAVFHNLDYFSEEQRKALKKTPAAARPTLPISKDGEVIKTLGHQGLGSHSVMSLVKNRFEAALYGKLR